MFRSSEQLHYFVKADGSVCAIPTYGVYQLYNYVPPRSHYSKKNNVYTFINISFVPFEYIVYDIPGTVV